MSNQQGRRGGRPHARGEQDVQRARCVDVVHGEWLFDRALDRSRRGLMQHAIHALHHAPASIPVCHAPLEEANLSPDGREILTTARREVV
jgi:hypothetical protein